MRACIDWWQADRGGQSPKHVTPSPARNTAAAGFAVARPAPTYDTHVSHREGPTTGQHTQEKEKKRKERNGRLHMRDVQKRKEWRMEWANLTARHRLLP